MAVAGINNVSVLESSYFSDNYSPVTRRWGNQEKPITRTSFIRKLWRDLEDESKIIETERQQMSVRANNNSNSNTRSQCSCSCSSEGSQSENMSINTSEVENECPYDQNQMRVQIQIQNEQSPAIGVADKERVRQVFREWRSKNSNGRVLNDSYDSNCSKLVCEDESKRVRTVRQWLESNSQQVEAGQPVVEEEIRVGGPKSIRLIYGRHALSDLLTRFEMERKKEMKSLLHSRPVSTFAHRKRIQALLKGRFLWNQRFVQDERSSSTAASELGLLRQSQTVSDLRKGFLSRVNSHEQAHDGPQSDTLSDNGMEYQENQLLEDNVNESDTSSDNDTNYQENQQLNDTVNESESESEGPQLSPPTEVFESRDQEPVQVEGSVELEVDETFDHLNRLETETDVLSWQEEIVEAEDNLTDTDSIQSLNANSAENRDEWRYRDTIHDGWYDNHHPVVTTDAFNTPDDNDNRPELQQLMSRRRVSNLLQSDFGVRLDQLLQSYLARQDQASESDDDWLLEMEHQENDNEAAESTESADDSWQHHPEINQHPATEWEIINGLRMDMVMLQERMNSLQNTLETCMKMQLELQRSVQQEVSSALNRSSNSGEESLQDCFLCCGNGFDSSPNRGGHVYVCSNCAEKINWSKVKESVRRP